MDEKMRALVTKASGFGDLATANQRENITNFFNSHKSWVDLKGNPVTVISIEWVLAKPYIKFLVQTQTADIMMSAGHFIETHTLKDLQIEKSALA